MFIQMRLLICAEPRRLLRRGCRPSEAVARGCERIQSRSRSPICALDGCCRTRGMCGDTTRRMQSSTRLSPNPADATTNLGSKACTRGGFALLSEDGRASDACAIEPPSLEDSLRSMRGEVLVSRALALASLGRLVEARELAAEAVSVTSGVETRVLCCCDRRSMRGQRRELHLMESIGTMVDVAYDAGAVVWL